MHAGRTEYLLNHYVDHKFGDRLIAEQTGAHQQVVFIVAGGLSLDKVEDISAHCQQWCAVVAKIFDNPADGRCSDDNDECGPVWGRK